jgi:hypothetical protein
MNTVMRCFGLYAVYKYVEGLLFDACCSGITVSASVLEACLEVSRPSMQGLLHAPRLHVQRLLLRALWQLRSWPER